METSRVHELIDQVVAVPKGCADRDALVGKANDVRQVRAWCDAQDLAVARDLKALTPCPEQPLAKGSRSSERDATKKLERAETGEAMPEVEEALGDGRVSAEHLDIITQALRQLEGAAKDAFAELSDHLSRLAEHLAPGEFRKRVADIVARIRHEHGDNGEQRLAEQKRQRRLRTWTDKASGMWRISGAFDPETGIDLHTRLEAAIAAQFAASTPADCPGDPGEKQDYLRALAFVSMVTTGKHCGPSKRDAVVVIHLDADHTTCPRVDWGIPIEVPHRVLAELLGRDSTQIDVIVIRNGVVLHAPGQLDLGRNTRVASRAQRRALRGLYSTCAIPGCEVAFDYCKIHHIRWWRHHGTTDLHNLLPVCQRHHSHIHDDGWHLTIDNHRNLTITMANGETITAGPTRHDHATETPPNPEPPDRLAAWRLAEPG